jgi:hypothetical protein
MIEDFRDTKRKLDMNIFKELNSWQDIFSDEEIAQDENEKVVRLVILNILSLWREKDNKRKKDVGLPISGDLETIRRENKEIFKYRLEIENNDTTKLEENKGKIQKISKLLHKIKIVNFPTKWDDPKKDNGIINLFGSYIEGCRSDSKVFEFIMSVWDKDYTVSVHRKKVMFTKWIL